MKKGFTLIELLAVIVILAIIALIATPIVLNIINDTKESATLRSADFYLDALELSIAQGVLENKNINDGTYSIMNNGNLCLETLETNTCTGDILEVEVNGETPTSGEITITSGNISEIGISYGDKYVVKNEEGELAYGKAPVCEYKNSEIVCGTESFYIIEQTDKIVTMLAKYNLNVGDNKYPNEATYGKQDENVVFTQVTGKSYGGVAFSTEAYWNESEVGTFVYNEKSNVYQYVNSYKEYLESIDVSVIDATLMSYEQFIEIGGCKFDGDSSVTTTSWAYCYSEIRTDKQYFWLGTANSTSNIWGFNGGSMFMGISYTSSAESGVRPLITIDKVQVKNLE